MNGLDGFGVELTFDDGGSVEKVEYVCTECGRVKEIGLKNYVNDLTLYHLLHYRNSHKRTPRKRCSFSVESSAARLRCTNQPHGDEIKHVFEL